jgi:hypothetical protein
MVGLRARLAFAPDIEVVRRRSPGGDREKISLNLQAVPSFETFSRSLEAANPFVFRAEVARLTWLGAARMMPVKRANDPKVQL